MRIDLHVHTTISDSSLNTKEMLYLAKEHGLTHVAITNHDTVSGLKEAIKLGKEIGIEVIPGIEISAYDFKQNKRKSLTLIIAIAISTCVFTMVATFMRGLINAAEEETIRDSGNYYFRMNDKNNEYYNEFIRRGACLSGNRRQASCFALWETTS